MSQSGRNLIAQALARRGADGRFRNDGSAGFASAVRANGASMADNDEGVHGAVQEQTGGRAAGS